MKRWEELGKTPEEYVRSSWLDANLHRGLIDQDEYGWWVTINGVDVSKRGFKLRDDALLVAAEYTAEHEEAIRLKREEITYLYFRVLRPDLPIIERILAVLEAQLAELLVGWKEQP